MAGSHEIALEMTSINVNSDAIQAQEVPAQRRYFGLTA